MRKRGIADLHRYLVSVLSSRLCFTAVHAQSACLTDLLLQKLSAVYVQDSHLSRGR